MTKTLNVLHTSIGTFTTHANFSSSMANMGSTLTFFYAALLFVKYISDLNAKNQLWGSW